MLGTQSGTSEREWECEVVLCESEMSEEEDIAAVMGSYGFGKTCKGRSSRSFTPGGSYSCSQTLPEKWKEGLVF